MKPVSQLIEEYADACVNSMDMDTVCTFAKMTIEADLAGATDAYIIETIRDHYPDLLDE
jgi:hypothetical protein